VTCLITQTLVSAADPGSAHPTKSVGPVYSEADAASLADERGWTVQLDGLSWRRVVPSPVPYRRGN
jgi:carbamate kinase